MIIEKYNSVFDHVEISLKEMFENNPRFDNVVFLLGYNCYDNFSYIKTKYSGKKIIIIQLEQLFHGSKWWNNKTVVFLKSADEVWDYDKNNITFLKRNGISAKFFPLPYTESLKKIPFNKNMDIDVLFYGYQNDRRANILTSLQNNYGKLKIVSLFNIWGDELDQYISRSKIILNIHYFDKSMTQEQVRLYYLIINNKVVVSESSAINYYDGSIIESKYSEITNNIIKKLRNTDWSIENTVIGENFRKNTMNFYKNNVL